MLDSRRATARLFVRMTKTVTYNTGLHTPFAALNVMFPNEKKPDTHQMERQGQHQEKYPQIEVTGVVEFVLVRVVVPAPGQRCPYSLTQGLHNLGAHLPSGLLLSAQVARTDDATAARLQ